jgi:carbamoyltransferase
MATVIGLAGARRNAATAIAMDGRVLAVCEQERVTRVRGVGLVPGTLPEEAIDCILRAARRRPEEVTAYVSAEPGIEIPRQLPLTRLDHHFGHAATALYSSPFDEAIVVVCDRHSEHGVSVWHGNRQGLRRENFAWEGPGPAEVYSATAAAFGFGDDGQEYRIEALARLGAGACAEAAASLIGFDGHRLAIGPEYKARVAEWAGLNGNQQPLLRRAEIADGIQRRLGAILIDLLKRVRSDGGPPQLCITGGLFYNSYFTTLIAQSGIFERTFVPINPGNAGVAVGSSLAVDAARPRTASLSPFLGPEYDPVEIKAVLDNCKVPYDYLDDGAVIGRTTAALLKGKLVGWFQGRMEWGARALGNRSILASPRSPYTLENLNVFLKQREPHRSYGVSVCLEDAPDYFEGPPTSTFMEFEFEAKDPDLFRPLMPVKRTRLRVQTVDHDPALFRRLLKTFGEASGLPVLVNTSFNGFHEPIVCTPRDAVRVFYGTGLDMAVIGNFVLEK